MQFHTATDCLVNTIRDEVEEQSLVLTATWL